jgi:cysteinyl-tRNA synthetase
VTASARSRIAARCTCAFGCRTTTRGSAPGNAAGGSNPAFREKFLESINDDLNMPRGMAVIQEMLKSDISESEKHATILDFDRVLGLGLDQVDKPQDLPAEVQKLLEARRRARASKDFKASDRLRDEIQALGYEVKDTREGMKVVPR